MFSFLKWDLIISKFRTYASNSNPSRRYISRDFHSNKSHLHNMEFIHAHAKQVVILNAVVLPMNGWKSKSEVHRLLKHQFTKHLVRQKCLDKICTIEAMCVCGLYSTEAE